MWRWPRIRDVTLFVCGLLGVAHETFLENTDRPELLVMFGAMMGLPAFLNADLRRPSDRRRDREESDR